MFLTHCVQYDGETDFLPHDGSRPFIDYHTDEYEGRCLREGYGWDKNEERKFKGVINVAYPYNEMAGFEEPEPRRNRNQLCI